MQSQHLPYMFLQRCFVKLKLYLSSLETFIPSRRVRAVSSFTVIIIVCTDKSDITQTNYHNPTSTECDQANY